MADLLRIASLLVEDAFRCVLRQTCSAIGRFDREVLGIEVDDALEIAEQTEI
jgi:hypothetical protein